ncbi:MULTISPECIES: immunity 26/phosphotriesterase HocA family protein [unclassified Variovorax]|uniref:immunity 26/phosphotriesterase HocA family protein n=1 Tax=unclassified Variovorax TaxID=663243 RepID=UPI0008AB1FE7|nr:MULTISPECIES: immunity 26/phosphotriesterase HocA family protein [unclassified Variovorax]SEJ80463.1 Immunity protein 26 [Variovorax sp. OK202]SFC93664.1 Immunity protein 26 [Variovorax sp. OK212]
MPKQPSSNLPQPFFELDNAERDSVGLDPVEPHWTRVMFKDTVAFFDGGTLRKFLRAGADGYLEVDTLLETRERAFLLPKTSRGKERKISAAVLLMTERANGRWFQASFIGERLKESDVSALNTRNMRAIDFWQDGSLHNHAELRVYLRARMQRISDGLHQEIAEMKSAPRQQLKYRPGDVFRFRIDDTRYGFGLLLGSLKEIRAAGLLPQDHPWHYVMSVPLIVRLFDGASADPHPGVEALSAWPLLPAQTMMDNQLFWGGFPVIGRKALVPGDIDFPCGVGTAPTQEGHAFFYWGFGWHRLADAAIGDETDSGMGIGMLDRTPLQEALAGRVPGRPWELRHPEHAATFKRVLAEIGCDGVADYAAYAQWAGSLSPEAFIAQMQPAEPTLKNKPKSKPKSKPKAKPQAKRAPKANT